MCQLMIGLIDVHLLQGSARQLFQRLQGPVEEDTIREHFDKIIQIGQKQRQRRIQVCSIFKLTVVVMHM